MPSVIFTASLRAARPASVVWSMFITFSFTCLMSGSFSLSSSLRMSFLYAKSVKNPASQSVSVASYHAPLQYMKKSSPGLTDMSLLPSSVQGFSSTADGTVSSLHAAMVMAPSSNSEMDLFILSDIVVLRLCSRFGCKDSSFCVKYTKINKLSIAYFINDLIANVCISLQSTARPFTNPLFSQRPHITA